jgi:class 3 adenylate cyclase/tetratricopeptide (TPR) repeat protein/nucleoside-triphosphatase THEP1
MLGGRTPVCQTSGVLATRTFLFADLREYTSFVERHGDAAATTLIADYRRIVRGELARHEGGEIKTEGDSFYVVFTNTGSAVTCAAAILRAAEAYSRDRPDRPLRIGVGIHAGEPVPHEGQFVGTAVIVAARLAQSAKAGELLITEVVRALLPRSQTLPMTERTGLALKGLDDPPKVFSVEWAAAPAVRRPLAEEDIAISASAPASQQVLCPVVIGRDREARLLDGYLAEAIAGHGRTVLVSGEAGLGKSALMRRFQERIREQGVRLLIGECTEIEARRPFGPFIDALVTGDLALPAELEQGGPGALPVAEVERYRVHLAFAERLAEAARERPVVVLVEDLHWGDEATFELFPYLARKLKDNAVLLIATYRSDELHRLHPLNHVLAELTRSRLAEDIRLKRLTLEEVGLVIGRALGLTQAPTAAFRQAIFDRTEGNPFFVEEILRALVEKGELAYRDGAWHREKEVADLTIPASVRDAVQQRLLGLEPNARRAMQIAAVIGLRFDFELLEAVSKLDERTLFDAIKAAIEAQLVREDTAPDGNDTYAFRHALSREAVLAELLQRERRLLHRAVGEALEAIAGSHPDTRAEELAYHFDEARDVARAFRYHRIAAERSLRMAAPVQAMAHLERAIELAADDEPALVDISLRLADVATSMADNSRALRAAEQARAIADQRGDRLGAGEAIHRIATFQWMAGATQDAERTVREGIALLEPLGSSGALAACYTELARLAMIDNRDDEAVAYGERGIAMARETGALQTEIFGLNFVGTALSHDAKSADDGLALLRRSLAMAEEHDLPQHAQRAFNNTAASLIRLGRPYAERRAVVDRAIAHARRNGLRGDPLINAEMFLALDDGDWDLALRIGAEAHNDTVWSAIRDLLVAIVNASRSGPASGAAEAADAAAHRLIAAGDTQWLSSATIAGVVRFLFADYQGVAARQASLLRPGRLRNEPVLQSAATGLVAARRAGDDATLRAWQEALEGATTEPTPGQLAGRRLASGMLAWREGRHADAAADLAAATTFLDEQHLRLAWCFASQDLAALLAETGDAKGAAAAFAPQLAYWHRAKADWYLAELTRWAAEQGIPLADQ